MIKDYSILKDCPLFSCISENELKSMINCLNMKEVKVSKGETIFNINDPAEYFGIVLEGSVHIIQEDYWGNRTILAVASPSELFAEAFACGEAKVYPISVVAQKDTRYLLIKCDNLLSNCKSTCIFHTRLVSNLMKIIANKNIFLTQKMEHITKKSTKEKVLSYLSKCALIENSNSFYIPFNRQELADYLSVERSALSNTLCKMRDEGLINFNKNHFTLKS